jgi:3-oxocholest-4-en-26-oate---CoA ligase
MAAPAVTDERSHLSVLFEHLADALGDAAAIVQGERCVRWTDFDDRASRLAAVLVDAGLCESSVVAIDLYNCPEYFEVFHGALKASLVPANVNYRYVDDELVSLLTRCDAKVLVFDASMAEQIERVRPELGQVRLYLQVDHAGRSPVADGVVGYEPALASVEPLARRSLPPGFYLSFTGGTTGLPKGVMYNLDRATRNGFGLRDMFLGLSVGGEAPVDVALRLRSSGDAPVTIPASPLMHSTGFIFVSLPTLQAGGTVVLDESRSFDPHELWRTVARQRASVVGIVGDAFAAPMRRALDEAREQGQPYDTSSLRVVCSAGVAWSAHLKEHLFDNAPGVRLVDACGSTEGATYGMRITASRERVATASFDPMPGVVVLAADGTVAPDGEVGLLASPTPSDGYYLDPERTRHVFRTIDGQPYTVPGDFGRIEPDGSLTLIGRGTSTINTGGEKVHPEEVEHVIKGIPGVEDVIVVGVPDERFGTAVAAVLATRPGADLRVADVDAAVRRRLASYKAPRHIVFVPVVPRLANGKPDFAAAAAAVLEEMHLPDTDQER